MLYSLIDHGEYCLINVIHNRTVVMNTQRDFYYTRSQMTHSVIMVHAENNENNENNKSNHRYITKRI